MKSYIAYILSFILFFCSCQKLLDENPKYSINSITAYESESTATMALLSCYGYLASYNTFGQAGGELMVGASGLSWAQTNNGDQDQFVSFNIADNNTIVNMWWVGLYDAIGAANYTIAGLEASSLSPSFISHSVAEARFVRALSYFYLVNTFGSVPLRTSPTSTDNMNVGRTEKEKIHQQIEKDFLFASENLKRKSDRGAEGYGRATQEAAEAFLSKFYFYLASNENNSSSPYWAKAKQHGDRVISSGAFDLESEFANLFNNYSSSAEAIFQINFTTTSAYIGNRGSWVFAPPNSTSGISWGRIRASKAYYDLFINTHPNDPRIGTTFITEWLQNTNNTNQYSYPYVRTGPVPGSIADSIRYALSTDPTNPEIEFQTQRAINAFINVSGNHNGWPYFGKQVDYDATAQNSNKNIIIYRYADLLLLMAEVENELGNQEKAAEYLNRVLTRARQSEGGDGIHPLAVSTTDPEILSEKIRLERLFELGGEYEQYIDIRRRGEESLQKIISLNNDHHITKAFVEQAKNSNNTTNFRDRLLPNSKDAMLKNLLLPIPRNELNTNEEMTQQDQNFGY